MTNSTVFDRITVVAQTTLIKWLPRRFVNWLQLPFAIDSEEAITNHVFDRMSPHEREVLVSAIPHKHMLHWTLGTYIRNTYGLWHSSPVTAFWRENSKADLKNASFDFQYQVQRNHPDSVSNRILDNLIDLCKAYEEDYNAH